jgi:chemotaxis protein CheD
VALPDSRLDQERAKDRPGFFADTAIPILLDAFADSGLIRDPGEYTVKLVGGANVIDRYSTFDLGKRIVNAVKETLEQCKLKIAAQEIGGRFSRAVSIHVESGKVEMIAPGRESKFI